MNIQKAFIAVFSTYILVSIMQVSVCYHYGLVFSWSFSLMATVLLIGFILFYAMVLGVKHKMEFDNEIKIEVLKRLEK